MAYFLVDAYYGVGLGNGASGVGVATSSVGVGEAETMDAPTSVGTGDIVTSGVGVAVVTSPVGDAVGVADPLAVGAGDTSALTSGDGESVDTGAGLIPCAFRSSCSCCSLTQVVPMQSLSV